jgi:DNA repair exonuclease SbcCD ATPase subunit
METINEKTMENVENKENVEQETDPLQALTELEDEIKLLSEEKLNLHEIEEKLISKINEEVENRKRKRDELKKQIEDLRIRCEMLTKVLNSFANPNG